MGASVQPTPAPNLELELAKLANSAIASGANPGDTTAKLHAVISYFRQFPKMAQQATNALADGATTPADITRTIWPHIQAIQGAAQSAAQDGPAPTDAQQLADELKQDPFLPHLANLSQGIPGVEALQAKLRSLVRGQSYPEALGDIRGATSQIPPLERGAERIAGAIPATALMPGFSPAAAGATFGAADRIGNADPSVGLKQRLEEAPVGAAVGGILGKLLDVGSTGVRAAGTPTPGANMVARRAALKAADQANYGAAAREGTVAAASPMPQAVPDAFAAKDIAPYVQAVRDSRQFADADDPTVLREAYKLMSERQGTLGNRIINADDFKAGSTLENQDIGLAKQQLLDAADQVMPSFRPAVQQHAELAGQQSALQQGTDAATRALHGTLASGKKLATKSSDAYLRAFSSMNPAEQQAALEGVLGRVREGFSPSANPLTGFGVGRGLLTANRVSPYVHALDPQTTGLLTSLLAGGNATQQP